MQLQKNSRKFSLSPRDLAVMSEAKVGFNQITNLTLKHPGLPPLWSRLPYLMLLHRSGTTTKYFWKAYREFDELLRTRDSHYKQAYIPKASGGTRELLVPDWNLRHHQRFIQTTILYKIPISQHACAYHKRRSLKDLAAPHIGHSTLIHIDIKNFFSSITEQMVFETIMRETGYPKTVAGYLSRLCCYKRYLPQGACTSPALSNICFKVCDDEIAAFAKQYELTYTRYSDDIYISGNFVDPAVIIRNIKRILNQHGFRINSQKTKTLGRHQAQMVTAIVVNDKMQVSREYRRKLRQEVYFLKRFKENSRDAYASGDYIHYLYQLHGKTAFVLFVDPENKEFLGYKELLERMIDSYWNNYHRRVSMSFDELSTLDENFEEDELTALEALPRNQDGLSILLDHLRSFDSEQAWCYLFNEFLPVLTVEQYRKLKEQAKSVWGEDGLSSMLPHIFSCSDESGT